MKLKLRKIAVVLTAALPLAAANVPTKAEAFGFLLAPVLLGSALLGAGALGGGGYGGDGYPYDGGGYVGRLRLRRRYVGMVTLTVAVTVAAVTLTVGMAAAVEFGLRLRRRAVTTAGVAAVGMVAGKAIEWSGLEPAGSAQSAARWA